MAINGSIRVRELNLIVGVEADLTPKSVLTLVSIVLVMVVTLLLLVDPHTLALMPLVMIVAVILMSPPPTPYLKYTV